MLPNNQTAFLIYKQNVLKTCNCEITTEEEKQYKNFNGIGYDMIMKKNKDMIGKAVVIVKNRSIYNVSVLAFKDTSVIAFNEFEHTINSMKIYK